MSMRVMLNVDALGAQQRRTRAAQEREAARWRRRSSPVLPAVARTDRAGNAPAPPIRGEEKLTGASEHIRAPSNEHRGDPKEG
jgi:hypothetical protein